jgi:hypothetical protein
MTNMCSKFILYATSGSKSCPGQGCSTKKNSMSTYIEFNRIFQSNSLDYVPMMIFFRKLTKTIPEKYDFDL